MITGNEPARPLDIAQDGFRYYEGLTIRQQFAMAAMQGLCPGNFYSDIKKGQCADIAECAVLIADALIAELNKEK